MPSIVAERMKARAELVRALTDALPLHDQDGRIIELAAAIENMIDLKLSQLQVR